jgi:hypothetical protein
MRPSATTTRTEIGLVYFAGIVQGLPPMTFQVWMSAAPVGARVHADVRGRCLDLQSALQERIFDAKPEREG